MSGIQGMSFGKPMINGETGKISFSPKMLDSFDPTEIIDTLKTVKESRLQKKPTADLEKSTEGLKDLAVFKEKLTAYQKTLSALRGAGEGLGQGGVFAATAVQGTSNNPQVDPGDLIAFAPAEGMGNQSFTLSVASLARQDRTTAMTAIPDSKAALGWAGQLDLGTENASGEIKGSSLTITATMTLDNIVFLVNSRQSDTGVRATCVKVADNDYRLQFQSLKTGDKITLAGDVGAGGQMPAPSPLGVNDLRSHIVYNGQDIYRLSNTITDIAVPFGVLDLKKADPDTALTITMTQNSGDVRDAVETWMAAHNDLQTFINHQKGLKTNDDGGDVKKGPLYNTAVLKEAENILNTFSTSHGSGDIKSLRAAGIIRSDMGMYEFDQTVNGDTNLTPFEGALKDRFSDLEGFFAFKWSCDSVQFRPVGHPNQMPTILNGQDITVTFERDHGGRLLGTLTGGGQTLSAEIAETSSGAILDGPKGSIFHGISILARDIETLAPGASRTAIIKGTQGASDRAERALTLFLSPQGAYDPVMGQTVPAGPFESAINLLSGQKDEANQKLMDIKERMERFTDREMGRFQKSFDLYNKLTSLTMLLDQMNESNG